MDILTPAGHSYQVLIHTRRYGPYEVLILAPKEDFGIWRRLKKTVMVGLFVLLPFEHMAQLCESHI